MTVKLLDSSAVESLRAIQCPASKAGCHDSYRAGQHELVALSQKLSQGMTCLDCEQKTGDCA